MGQASGRDGCRIRGILTNYPGLSFAASIFWAFPVFLHLLMTLLETGCWVEFIPRGVLPFKGKVRGPGVHPYQSVTPECKRRRSSFDVCSKQLLWVS